MIDLVKKNNWGEIIVSPTSVITKFEQQLNIIKSLKERFNSSLYDIKQLLQANIFDSELESATELCKKGFCSMEESTLAFATKNLCRHMREPL